MQISVRSVGNAKVVALGGPLSGHEDEIAGVVESITFALDARGGRLVLDMSGVPFVSSSGLSALVRIAAQANVQEGRVILANPTAVLTNLLELTRLNQFLETAASVEEALERLT